MSSPYRLIIIFAISIITASQLNAQQIITGSAPTITSVEYAGTPLPVSYLQDQVDAAWPTILSSANDNLIKYSKPDDLAKGFANANAYASRAATLQGYQDYSLFAFTGGVMLGIQAPDFNINRNRVEKMREEIKDEGDVYMGISAGMAIANAGVNAGFIYPGLYINLKYGNYKLDGKDISDKLEGFSYKTALYGIGINQTVIWPRSIVPGLFKWRGISIGTGFYYCKTSIGIEILEDLTSEGITTIPIPGYDPDNDTVNDPITGALALDPSFIINIDMTTMTIPLDISTSFRLLYVLNLNIGGGIDFCFGSSDIKFESSSNVIFESADTDLAVDVEPGTIQMAGGVEDEKPSLLNPRLTAGIGFNLGIFKIDIPVAVYLDSGFSAGLTAGLVW